MSSEAVGANAIGIKASFDMRPPSVVWVKLDQAYAEIQMTLPKVVLRLILRK
jgi:hypothetical protein